jgi:hypothetical protein
MKKNYNPFKMWGSYIGAILLLLFLGMVLGGNPLSIFLAKISFYILTDAQLFISGILHIIIGFFIGWAIHSLVRYFKK